jgi:hypothetical protein
VGERSHVLEFVFGSRSCDGQPADDLRENCDAFQQAGGWGNSVVSDGSNHVRIPNRNVYVYNNVLYNPSGYQSQWQHFAIFAPYSEGTQDGANVPLPTLADDNLQIRGNIIWNGPAEHPMGIEADAGCQPENPTCNMTQLLADNAINRVEPELGDDFHPVAGGNVFSMSIYPVPTFPGSDRPEGVPESDVRFEALTRDFEGNPRGDNSPPGAFAS